MVEIGESRVDYYTNTNVTTPDNYTTTTTPNESHVNHYQTTESDNREDENLVLFENYENSEENNCLFTCLFGTLCSFQVQSDPEWKYGQEQETLDLIHHFKGSLNLRLRGP